MTRTRKVAIASLLALPLLAGGFALQQRQSARGAQLLDQVLTFVALRYVDTVEAQALYEKAARGLVKELGDPYTELFTPKQIEEFSRNTNGRYAGLGMQITSVGGYVTVDKVFPNTPAEAGGVQEGDRIVAIDTFQARGWTTQQAQNRLLGEIGTRVNVTFGRPGVNQPIKQDFRRAEIHVPAVAYRIMVDDRIGYIPLQRFSEQTTQDIAESVAELRKKGAKGIVIDLRGNPGGILEEAFSMSNLFLPRGKELLSVRGRGEFQKFVAEKEPLAPDVPLVVLVDGYSASASEIVAGALQDYDRALVLGTTSYGKGLVQSIYPLDGGYALKITTGKWYTPSGRSIQKERKLNADGQYVEVLPDSLETDAARKARPAYKSSSGRVVYGGGAITPDMIVPADTISSKEQALARAIAPQFGKFLSHVGVIAQELKGKVPQQFTTSPAWREDLYRRLAADSVRIDKAVWDAGAPWVDRYLDNRIARVSFGEGAAKLHELNDDNQLLKAMAILRNAATQKDVFAAAATMGSSTAGLARSSKGLQ
jgi:carboxyl-terminal processing protease